MPRAKPVKPVAPPPEVARTPILVGYGRVSMADQNPQLQVDALHAAGVDPRDVWIEQGSGKTTRRPMLERAVKACQPGDVLVVWKLDRIGRNAREVLNFLHEMEKLGIGVRIITQPGMDTTTPTGRLLIAVMAAVAEMERDLIRERTLAGLKSARDRGRGGGRKALATRDQLLLARQQIAQGQSVAQVAKALGYKNRTTLHKAFAREGIPLHEPE